VKKSLLIAVAIMSVGAKKPASLPAPQAITAKDKATGSKAHPQLVAEFGGAFEGPQAAYVTKVGQRIAVESGLSNSQGDFTVTLLNSNVNNAFAVPGGYVYVTRQLLALMNDEAELASVMGHEVGHVAARHSQQRSKRSTIGGIGAVLATVLGAAVGGDTGAKLGQQLGGAVAQNFVLSFSRSQEFQADDLGVSYLGKAGYDPLASSTMLASLAGQTALEMKMTGGKLPPVRESTHPDPASRVTRAAQKAGTTAAVAKARNRDQFLNAIDGMIYDDDPRQGIIDGTSFRHSELRLAFAAPSGFALVNTPSAVIVNGTGGQAQFTGNAYGGDLRAYVDTVFRAVGGQTQLDYGRVQTTEVNGLRAAYATANANIQSGPVAVTVFAYEFASGTAFHFLAITPQNSVSTFEPLFRSMRRLTAAESAAIKPRKVDVIVARSGDTVASLSNRMAYTSYREERFRTLNALRVGEPVRSGQRYKLIVY
jgi:predicted Zn-dependent protease